MSGSYEPVTQSSPVPQIFERRLVLERLARARRLPVADFLLLRAAEDIIDRLNVTLRPFQRVLDLATPADTLVRALSARASTGTFQQTLTRAAPLLEAPADAFQAAAWRTIVCDAENLPFVAGSFDLIVSALALQWVNDLPGVLIQIRRALSPDGLFIACLAGGQTLHELRTVFAMAEDEITGGASPHVAPFADLRDLGGLLQRAGFALPVTDTDTICVRYANMFALMADLRAMGATNALTARSRKPLRRSVLLRAVQLYQQMFADPDGRIRATFELIWLSGWAPHESQQKPLAPGSARMRLADALKTRETKLPDAD